MQIQNACSHDTPPITATPNHRGHSQPLFNRILTPFQPPFHPPLTKYRKTKHTHTPVNCPPHEPFVNTSVRNDTWKIHITWLLFAPCLTRKHSRSYLLACDQVLRPPCPGVPEGGAGGGVFRGRLEVGKGLGFFFPCCLCLLYDLYS